MKKEQFVELGLDEEIAKKCEAASEKELKDYVPYSRFKEVVDEKNTLKTTITERDTQLEELKNSNSDVESLKTTIETLQADNKAKDEVHANEIYNLKLSNAVDAAIGGVKGKNSIAIKALLNLKDAKIDEDGTVKGLNEQLEAIKKSDSYLFDTEVKKATRKGVTPGEGSTDGNEGSTGGIDISKMTYTELAAYMAENPEVTID